MTTPEISNYKSVTTSNFKTEVLESDGPVLVDFWAPWCEPCLKLESTIKELTAQYDGAVKVVRLNVDENPGVASAYRIPTIPAVVLFDEGRIIQTFIGEHSKHHYERALNNIAGDAGDSGEGLSDF